MRWHFDICIKDHRQQAYPSALWSLATPLHIPLGRFNYLHSRGLVRREICWPNEDFPAAPKKRQRGNTEWVGVFVSPAPCLFIPTSTEVTAWMILTSEVRQIRPQILVLQTGWKADILVIDDRLRYPKQNPCGAEKKKFLLAVLPFTSGYHSGWIHIFDFAQIWMLPFQTPAPPGILNPTKNL